MVKLLVDNKVNSAFCRVHPSHQNKMNIEHCYYFGDVSRVAIRGNNKKRFKIAVGMHSMGFKDL